MRAVTGLLWLLAFGTQAVHSFTSVVFSPVKQCGSFSIKFSGGFMPAVLPLTLTIVPFDDVPIAIPIPANSWNNATSTGAAVTFLPLRAGTFFVASLDDADGIPTGSTSDIIRVQESDDATCVPAASPTQQEKVFAIEGTLGQCEPFNVTFDPNVVRRTPTVRGFIPIGPGSLLKQGKPPSEPGVQEFILAGLHGFQVSLLIDDGQGHRETTKLTPIAGDSLSPLSCIEFPKPTQTTIIGASQNTSGTGSLSGAVKIIIGVVCGGVVGSVAVIMVFLVRRRRVVSPSTPRDPESPSPSLSSNSTTSKTFSFTEDISVGSIFGGSRRSNSRAAPSRTSFTCPLGAIHEVPKENEKAQMDNKSVASRGDPIRPRSEISDRNNPFSNAQRVPSFDKGWEYNEKTVLPDVAGQTPPNSPPSSEEPPLDGPTISPLQTSRSLTLLSPDGSPGRSRRPCPDAPLPAVPLSPISRIDSTELRPYGSIGRFITASMNSSDFIVTSPSEGRTVVSGIRVRLDSTSTMSSAFDQGNQTRL